MIDYNINGIQISLADKNKGSISVSTKANNITFHYPCEKLDCTNYVLKLSTGTYLLQAIGASGGDCLWNEMFSKPGFGGISQGVLKVLSPTTVHLYIGGIGSECDGAENPPGGYNGGGNAYGIASAGGGATDFRFIGGMWNNSASIESRFIVGAGGGGGRPNANSLRGGNGGGVSGEQGKSENSNNVPCIPSQTSCSGQIGLYVLGTKGQGGNVPIWGSGNGGGGGGSGYFGGGGAAGSSGSGGSGYIGGVGELAGYPKFTKSFNNFGNGYAIITIISSSYYTYHCAFKKTRYLSLPSIFIPIFAFHC